MSSVRRPRLSTLTGFAYQLNMHLEDGHHGLTFDDVYAALKTGELRDFLERKIPGIDIRLFTEKEWGQSDELLATLREAAEVTRGRERRKTGVSASGLALLMTFVLEAIQQEWWVPDSGSRFVEK